jgi:hypothetical protein
VGFHCAVVGSCANNLPGVEEASHPGTSIFLSTNCTPVCINFPCQVFKRKIRVPGLVPCHARDLEVVAKSQSPLKARVFKSQTRTYVRCKNALPLPTVWRGGGLLMPLDPDGLERQLLLAVDEFSTILARCAAPEERCSPRQKWREWGACLHESLSLDLDFASSSILLPERERGLLTDDKLEVY